MISEDSSIILWRRHQKQFHSLHRLLNVNTYTPSPRAMSEVCHDALWWVWHVSKGACVDLKQRNKVYYVYIMLLDCFWVYFVVTSF